MMHSFCFLATILISIAFVSGFSTVAKSSNCAIRLYGQKGGAPKALPKMSFGALVQLITMGAGAPSLGEYERTDENGKMLFKLEANNFADSDGNSKQTKAKYFNDGYVEDENSDKPPGFFSNLLSGGQKQRDWESRVTKENK